MKKAISLLFTLVLAGYFGDSFAEPPVIGNLSKDYRMYPSSLSASIACGNESSERNGGSPYPFATCEHNSLGNNSGEYFVTYDFHQAGGPPQRVSSPNRYAYHNIQAVTSTTRTQAETRCNDAGNWVVGVVNAFQMDNNPYTNVQHRCTKLSGQAIRLTFVNVPSGSAFPSYDYVYNQPPTVSISSPANGAVYYIGDATVTISGTASDPEDGSLSGNIKWYINGQFERQDNSFAKTFTTQGTKTIKAEITDSSNVFNATTSTTRTIRVEEAQLVLSDIIAIMDSPHEAYKPVRLTISTATVNGDDARGSINWQSSINGLLGTGGSISVNLLPGTHVISATLSAYGESVTIQKTITVINDRPHVVVQSPAGGRVFDMGETIHFEGALTFRGQPVASGLSWISDISGPIGTGNSFDLSDLPEGKHEITVSVTLNNETDTKSLFLTVYDRQKNQGNKSDGICFGGNPINLLSGNKYHEETDFSTATELPLYLYRGYNSTSRESGIFGYGWSSNITEHIEHNVAAQQAAVIDESGAAQRFDYDDGAWVDTSSRKGQLERLTDESWRYTLYDGTIKTYNAQGQILSLQKINGLSLAFIYNTDAQLLTVADEFGYALDFAYNNDGRIEQFTDPDGQVYRYTYDIYNNLEYVIYPDATPASSADNPRKRYIYENTSFPHALTGIVDEEGILFATWAYDQYGRANFSKHGLNDEQFSVAYNSDGTTTTTNALAKQTTYAYKSVKGILKVSSVTGHRSTHCASSFQSVTYDPNNGFENKKIDWRNNQILLEHNEFGQVTNTTVVETGTGWTTPMDERVITSTQYNTLQLPETINKPGLRLERMYNLRGRLDLVTATDTTLNALPYSTNGETRVTDYIYILYDDTDLIHFIDINGPRTDVNDAVRYEYDTKGNLIRITNIALNQSIQYQNHNGRGQPGRMIDINGLVTDYQFSLRGWLERETVHSTKGDAVTQYSYYSNGLLKTVIAVNGSTLTYQYNNARQLLAVTNNLGEREVAPEI